MKRVFRYVQKRSAFFESIVLVWMLAVNDGDHRHRMSRTTFQAPPISNQRKHKQKVIHLLPWEEE